MATLKSLKKEALESAKFRGHKMGGWSDTPDLKSSQFLCTICDAWVQVQTNPAPNSIDIGGSAVAIGCGDE